MTQPARGEGAQPLLSVVVPVYNAQDYLQQCLDAVLGSTLRDLELICVDDGSTDGSPQILQQRCAADGRMRVITQEHSCAGAARNTGLRAARGVYVHFLDADDWVASDAYEKWVAVTRQHDAQVCECLHANVDARTGKTVSKGWHPYNRVMVYPEVTNIKKNPRSLINGNVVVWDKLYLRDFLVSNRIEFDELVCAEDRPFHFYVIYRAEVFVRVLDEWVFHRVGVPTSLDGSDIRLRNFEVEFTTFELIWAQVQDVSDEERLAVLDTCINDSVAYYRKSVGTEYERAVAEKLHDYWRDYLPLFGKTVYDRQWYGSYLDSMIEPLPPDQRESIRGLFRAYRRAAKVVIAARKLPDRASVVARCLAGFARESLKRKGR